MLTIIRHGVASRCIAGAIILCLAAPARGETDATNKQTQASELAKQLKVSVRAVKPAFSAREQLQFYVFIENVGVNDVIISRWVHCCSFQGGLRLDIYDQHGDLVGIKDHLLWPPAPNDDPAGVVRLSMSYFFGFRVSLDPGSYRAGHYTVKAVYESHLERKSLPRRMQHLPVLWAGTPRIESKPATFEVH